MNDLAILEKQLQPLAPRFEAALGGLMPVERLMRTVMISVERTPKLLECTRESIFGAAMSAAVLGLEVDGITGQAFLVPFKGKAQLIIGYKGYSTIAARNGITIYGAVVREGDAFEYELGSAPFIRHKPQLGNERGRKILAAYACAAASNRPFAAVVLSIDEILMVKARSAGAQRQDSPWNDPYIGFPAMAEKSAKRRLARTIPMAAFQRAARLDEVVEEEGKPAHLREDGALIIEGEAEKPAPKPQPTAAELTGPNAGASQAASAGPQQHEPAATPAGAAAPTDPQGDQRDSRDDDYGILVSDYERRADAIETDKDGDTLKQEVIADETLDEADKNSIRVRIQKRRKALVARNQQGAAA